MNEDILKLSLRIAADITMSQSLKDELMEKLSQPLSEQQIQEISLAMDEYQATTKPIIDRALNRLSDTELVEIENISRELISEINTDTESFTGHAEKNDAENILSTI